MIDLHEVKAFSGVKSSLEEASTEETLVNEDLSTMTVRKPPHEEAVTEPGASLTTTKSRQSPKSDSLADHFRSKETTSVPSSSGELPKAWIEMANKIRQAVKSRPTASPHCHSTPRPEPSAKPPPTSDYILHITDEMREVTEVTMQRGDLTHNKAEISLNELMSAVQKYNESDIEGQRVDLAGILQRTYIVRKNEVSADLYLEGLKPAEILRLQGSERRYQRMISKNMPLFKKLRAADDLEQDVPNGLAIELRGSMAMALSMLVGLFTSFFCGYFGGPYVGAGSQWARAVLGLVFTIAFLVVEVSLILVRYSKLDRLQDLRRKRKERRKELARRKYEDSSTKET